MNVKLYHDFAVEIAKKAGKILLEFSQKNFRVSYKNGDPRNLVTEVDHASEKLIVDAIKQRFPDHCFLAEESGDCGIKPSDYKWIIDPLDGTTNYAHGYNSFAISIALMHRDEIIVGVIYAPMLNELFHAARGLGAFLNDKPLKISEIHTLETALLATGFNQSERGLNMPVFAHILPQAQGIRRAGSVALDIAYTAAGRLDGFWEMATYPWDIAAGIILVEEAGGQVTDIHGKKLNLSGIDPITVLATNGKIHAEMLKNIAASKTATGKGQGR